MNCNFQLTSLNRNEIIRCIKQFIACTVNTHESQTIHSEAIYESFNYFYVYFVNNICLIWIFMWPFVSDLRCLNYIWIEILDFLVPTTFHVNNEVEIIHFQFHRMISEEYALQKCKHPTHRMSSELVIGLIQWFK